MAILKIGNKVYNKGIFFSLKKERFLQTPYLTGQGEFNGPQCVTIDKEGGRIFVANAGGNFGISILDYVDPTILIGFVSLSSNVYKVTLDIPRSRIIATTSSYKVFILDYQDPTQIIQTIPNIEILDCFIDIDNNRIITGRFNKTFIDIYSYNFTLQQSITTTSDNWAIEKDKKNNKIITASRGSNLVTIRNPDTLAIENSFSISSPRGISIDNKFNELYVGSSNNFINIYDLDTLAIKRTITQSEGALSSPRFLTIDVFYNRLFVPNGGANYISLFQ